MKQIITMCFILLGVSAAQAQFEETLKEEIVFEKQDVHNVFYLANINGGIKVEAYNGDKIMLEARKKIDAKTTARLDEARQELSLGIIDRYDTIIVYIKGACEKFGRYNRRYGKENVTWNYNWNDCEECNYDFSFDFTLKVPQSLNLYLSTINKGDISVAGVAGNLNVHNVNGAIRLDGVAAQVHANTINGDVDINYKQLPEAGSRSFFYTLNGDINANYPKGLKADMSFKSFNGDFYTNIDEIEYKPAMVSNEEERGEGVSFKLDVRSMISVRGGGVPLDFETFNGDVFVREN